VFEVRRERFPVVYEMSAVTFQMWRVANVRGSDREDTAFNGGAVDQ